MDSDEEFSDLEDDYHVQGNNGKRWTGDQDHSVNSGDSSGNLRKLEGKIHVGRYEHHDHVGSKVANEITKAHRNEEVGRIRVKDKCDRATVEQVLDPKTRMILLKMLNRGVIESINGCISTGKEANVYHASTDDGSDRAIKVYKTSILTFRDRDKYVSGEFRFRNGYCKHNPRKMVRTWAEKEMRNLIRIKEAGIRCPEPFLLRAHVLLMEFIGMNKSPAPLLREVNMTDSMAHTMYLDCILLVRDLYTKARLVHADLSEFNILFDGKQLVVIDVSQAVEHDHPRALEFLRKDCCNINTFFRKYQVPTLTHKELFEFTTNPEITDANADEYLDKLQSIAAARVLGDEEKLEEEVFMKSYIPQRLNQVIDYERDIDKKETLGEELIYEKIVALKVGKTAGDNLEDKENSDDEGSEDESSNSSSEEPEPNEAIFLKVSNRRPRNEDSEARRERKKAVKEEKREKRKDKVPKHIKKRLTKGTNNKS